jgi:predicted Zn finger-like uncharacterized protein
MIVTCPSCSSRYRVPEERIQAKGARITCPNCAHKFVVHRGDEKVVIGADAPRGLATHLDKPAAPQFGAYDDEDEQPTSLLPRGSAFPTDRLVAGAQPKAADPMAGPAADGSKPDGKPASGPAATASPAKPDAKASKPSSKPGQPPAKPAAGGLPLGWLAAIAAIVIVGILWSLR